GPDAERVDGGEDVVHETGERQRRGAGAAADLGPGFTHEDRAYGAGESDGGSEAVRTRADDHGIEPPATHGSAHGALPPGRTVRRVEAVDRWCQGRVPAVPGRGAPAGSGAAEATVVPVHPLTSRRSRAAGAWRARPPGTMPGKRRVRMARLGIGAGLSRGCTAASGLGPIPADRQDMR